MCILNVSNLYIWKYHFSTPGIFKHNLFSCKGKSMRLADSENETAPVNTNFSDY